MSVAKHMPGTSRRQWRDVTIRHRCPVCNSDSWCQVGTGEAEGVTLCKRVASDKPPRVNAQGAEFWVHGQTTSDPASVRVRHVPTQHLSRASHATCSAAYSAILSQLTLSAEHRAQLLRRGLSEAQIRSGQYRTLPMSGRAAIARAVLDRVGDVATAVPGIVRKSDADYWTLAGYSGLLIPQRDLNGLIRALKIRCDDPDAPRYTCMSSVRYGGVSADITTHVPRWAEVRSVRDVIVTEGELKADVATALGTVPVIGVPGIANWAGLLQTLGLMRPQRVLVVSDHDTKPAAVRNVESAVARMMAEIRAAGLHCERRVLSGREGKGIDDVLLFRKNSRDGRGECGRSGLSEQSGEREQSGRAA